VADGASRAHARRPAGAALRDHVSRVLIGLMAVVFVLLPP
jgi:hypothetical protein